MEAKKIIITGSATRIGAAIARSLAGYDIQITLHYNKSLKDVKKLKTELEKLGSEIFLIKADLTKITQTKKIDKGVALELAKNFSVDRFSQDARISRNKRERFYQEWIINSFANKDIMLSVIGNNFCSFKVRGDSIKIDLLSVLDKRRGYAKDLLISINDYAVDHNIKKINVVTECENYPAFKAYTSNGFSVVGFLNCFHYKTKT